MRIRRVRQAQVWVRQAQVTPPRSAGAGCENRKSRIENRKCSGPAQADSTALLRKMGATIENRESKIENAADKLASHHRATRGLVAKIENRESKIENAAAKPVPALLSV
jgi:hypothetical protein